MQLHKALLDELQGEYARHEQRIEKMYEDYLDGRITESFGCKPFKAQTRTTISRYRTYLRSPAKRRACSRVLNLRSNGKS